MSQTLRKLLFLGLALPVLGSPAAATDLLQYDLGYAGGGYPVPAYQRPLGAYAGYPGPYGGRPDARDLARYCEPDRWALETGYVPPLWCFPGGPAPMWDGAGVPPLDGRNSPAPGYVPRPARDGGYEDYPYRAGYDLDRDPLR